MPNQVDGAFLRAPCPVPSCPACEPNTDFVHPNLPAKAARVEASRHCYAIMWLLFPTCPVGALFRGTFYFKINSRAVRVASTSRTFDLSS